MSALLSPSLVFACLWCCEELLTSLLALRLGRFFIPSMSLAALCDAIGVNLAMVCVELVGKGGWGEGRGH